ncbi:TIGR04086 family membrane protein [Metabacillus fastidiosus]
MLSTKTWGKAILSGLMTIFIIALITSAILSSLLKFTDIEESSIGWILITISFFALFIGGFISGRNGKEKGWLIGGTTALLFTIIILLLQFLGYGRTFTMTQTMYHGGFLAVAMLGGVFGVNLASARN